MRHSDGKLTDKIYTDENLLETGDAIESLPNLWTNDDIMSRPTFFGHKRTTVVTG